tara:strand:- start:7451 stop:8371 length:921 start_codon:yes stop_codon:yes gene_type:complete
VGCTKCEENPVVFRRYSGQNLCKSHFFSSIEQSFSKELRSQLKPFFDREDHPKRVSVGVSGGKDSTVALFLLSKWASAMNVEVIALSVNEGISGYRDESLEIAAKNCENLGVEIMVKSYEELVGSNLDQILEEHPPEATPCSTCGVLRRRALNLLANESKSDFLILGHNLDDCAQTILMNHSRGDISRFYRMAPHRRRQDSMVPRLLPLRRIPEREVYLYALLKEIPFHEGDCPHAKAAQRNVFRDILLELENNQPGTRFALTNGFDRIRDNIVEEQEVYTCPSCDEITGTEGMCRFCVMAESFSV